jgi:hypothetical protein
MSPVSPVSIDVGAHLQRDHLLKKCEAEPQKAKNARKAER